MVEGGQITAEEGAALLKLVSEEANSGPKQRPEASSAAPAATEAQWARPRRYWLYPVLGGSFLLLLGGAVVVSTYQQSRENAWTWLCGWIPLFLGLLVVTTAAWAQTAHWIHLRIISRDDRISLSFPLPLGLTALVLGLARRFISKFDQTGIDEAILGLRDELRSGQAITLEVQNTEQGEHIQIRID